MAEETKTTGDNGVGYRRPPMQHRFQKGKSGNPKGRPKSKKSGSTAVSELLNEPVRVKTGEKTRDMPLFEVGLRQQVKRALNKDLRAILKFVKICEEYGIIAPPPAKTVGGVFTAPKGVNFHEWLESVTEEVPVDEE